MANVLGLGGYVPERVMTNDDWAQLVDTTDEWITTRTGIKRRRFAADDESTLDLAAHAAALALADAGLTGADVDEIIVATDTPELYTPDTASLLQHRLGAGFVPTYDLGGSGCAGFVQALDVARSRIHMHPKRVLVVGVELISRLISWKDRATAVLFGDAAGAMVLGPSGGRGRLLDVLTGTDGSKAGILTLSTGGTRNPFNEAALAAGDHQRLTMEGREVFREAVMRMTEVVTELLERLGKTVSDVALVVPHQANKRIIDAVRQRLGASEEQVYVNVHEYGNTGSASVPFALWEAYRDGRIHTGDLVVLTAFGAGFHWAAAALEF
ncbi:MAG TPA: beta-ketoacyl-ACP synthase III [Acidimicrobiia bacterium]|jgi:3-oxoacyl-[acyl-carrier-protein] synthase-3|nr:beta-ketoacyl-ACP synthase III [Acidimicrobiia bacterium]